MASVTECQHEIGSRHNFRLAFVELAVAFRSGSGGAAFRNPSVRKLATHFVDPWQTGGFGNCANHQAVDEVCGRVQHRGSHFEYQPQQVFGFLLQSVPKVVDSVVWVQAMVTNAVQGLEPVRTDDTESLGIAQSGHRVDFPANFTLSPKE